MRGGGGREPFMVRKLAADNALPFPRPPFRKRVVVNKMDDPSVAWDKARYDEIESKLTPFLKASRHSTVGVVECIHLFVYPPTGGPPRDPWPRDPSSASPPRRADITLCLPFFHSALFCPRHPPLRRADIT